MNVFATRTYDALAVLDQQQPGQLHLLMSREPLEHEKASTLGSLDQLNTKLAAWPYLKFIHPSKLLIKLSLCPTQTLCYLIDWLPSPLKEIASRHTGMKPQILPAHPHARAFIMATWQKFLDSLSTCPYAFKPESEQSQLLELTEEELARRAQYMALYAIEPQLKSFIDKEVREKFKAALKQLPYDQSIEFIRYVQQNKRQLSQQLPYTFPLNVWNGTAQSLNELITKFGLACLSRLISQESKDFLHELNAHVSESFWQKMPKISTQQKPEVLNHLRYSFELANNFLEKNRI